ncbi:TPA: PTS sugar transporter subunit IIB [Listeria innocua]|uniref:PTS sugar transporter subunit IIB n=1 Tax=Listeria innocua TaxID=1642 RepID=UPI000FC11BB1|nr:PTS sugar transporter subunit IIB [Listeria innocua]QPQ95101.1 PTS sugar transporter subunit IIB [Listeria welshimeri]EAD5841261.1 PTS sugar transporter subunit IIB [Listeria innocua]EAG8542367.1 PTS sugar transporter subunit IIB [Listeria innocua]ECL7896569.1 PTS sugar transporter subunit IIB [Listeria innocua]ECL8006909.1 PTS sugar transporter subunit IIB [Listeria innocua]
MKIMLVCFGGLSTSILVKKMEEAIAASEKFKNKGITIEAWGKDEYSDHLDNVSIVLLGPQLSMAYEQVIETTAERGLKVPVEVIDKEDYGNMNAVPILIAAFKKIKEAGTNTFTTEGN